MSRFATMSALSCGLLFLGACQQPAAEMSMTPPPRAPQLDKLAVFVGTWEGTCECTMGGEKMKGGGSSEITWEADKQVILERGAWWMGDPSQKMNGVGMWNYDPKAGHYTMFWYDTSGDMSHGTATCDADGKSWTMTMNGRNLHTGKTSKARGTVKFTDANTSAWVFTMTDAWGAPMMEMTGTNKRKL